MFSARVILASVLAVFVLASSNAFADSKDQEEQEDYDAYHVRLSLFWFYSQPSGRFINESGTGFFDFQKDVAFNSYSTFYGKLDWKFTRKNHLFVNATDFDQSKDFTLNRTIVFRGQTFAVNSFATGHLRSRFLVPGYQYDIFRRKRWNLGFQVQANIFDISGFLKASAQVNNGAIGGFFIRVDTSTASCGRA